MKDNILLGFEYETLIDVVADKTDAFIELMAMIRAFLESKADRDAEQKKQPCNRISDIANNDDIIRRFVLASIFNHIAKKSIFKAAIEYHGEGCKTTIVDTKISKWLDKLLNLTDINIPGAGGKYWVITQDESVKSTGFIPLYRDYLHIGSTKGVCVNHLISSVEIVSPPMTIDYLENFDTIMKDIFAAGGMFQYYNNDKTSTHVHLSYTKDGKNMIRVPEILLKVCMAWWYFESVLLLLCGFWRRENKYCNSMRHLVGGGEDQEVLEELFNEMNEENMLEKMVDLELLNEDEINNPDINIQKIALEALITFFQGDISQKSTRYAALNMVNLLEGGIGTIEARIKQGSADVEENKQFMLLYSHFIKGCVESACVSEIYDETEKKIFWELPEKLSEAGWAKKDFVFKPALYSKCKWAFDELMKFVKDEGVVKYWTGVFDKLYPVKEKECPPGQVLNRKTGRCVKNVVKTPKSIVPIATSNDKLYFYSKSKDVAPGKGANESVEDVKVYTKLASIKDWRKILSNFHVCPFKYQGKTYNTIEHVFQSEKIKLVSPDKALLFTVESGSEIGLGDGEIARKNRKLVKLDANKLAEWGRIKDKIMADAAVEKYKVCKEAREVLKATGNAQLWHIVSRDSPVRFEHLEKIRIGL